MSDTMIFWSTVALLAVVVIVALGLIVASAWKGLAGEDKKQAEATKSSDDWKSWRKR